MQVEVEEPERQTLMLALAKLLIERPGWSYHIHEIVDKFDGRQLLDKFYQIHAEKKDGQ
jgi:hypothetical protein